MKRIKKKLLSQSCLAKVLSQVKDNFADLNEIKNKKVLSIVILVDGYGKFELKIMEGIFRRNSLCQI